MREEKEMETIMFTFDLDESSWKFAPFECESKWGQASRIFPDSPICNIPSILSIFLTSFDDWVVIVFPILYFKVSSLLVFLIRSSSRRVVDVISFLNMVPVTMCVASFLRIRVAEIFYGLVLEQNGIFIF